jgi:DNA invertase Pin-like site-specific DNA recombinase
MDTPKKRSRRSPAGDEQKAVAYLRVSRDEQQLGPKAQEDTIRAWAEKRGVAIVAWHVDPGVSGGAELGERPALMAALEALGEHGAGLLVVAKRDRLARDVLKAGAIEVAVSSRGARVVSADGVAEGADPTAILLRQLLDSFAQFEREMIRARTRAALQAKRSRGELTGKPRLGTRLAADGRTLEPNASERRAIERASELRRAGLSLRAIGAQLAAESFLSRAAKPYCPRSVALMLRA